MNLSFQEKSIWISLILTIPIFGYYFFRAFAVFMNPAIENTSLFGLFIGVVIILAVLHSIIIIILVIANKSEAEKGLDERDKLIELKATRVSYFIVTTGVWLSVVSIQIISSAFIIVNMLLFILIVSEIIGFTLRLIYYRKGI